MHIWCAWLRTEARRREFQIHIKSLVLLSITHTPAFRSAKSSASNVHTYAIRNVVFGECFKWASLPHWHQRRRHCLARSPKLQARASLHRISVREYRVRTRTRCVLSKLMPAGRRCCDTFAASWFPSIMRSAKAAFWTFKWFCAHIKKMSLVEFQQLKWKRYFFSWQQLGSLSLDFAFRSATNMRVISIFDETHTKFCPFGFCCCCCKLISSSNWHDASNQ